MSPANNAKLPAAPAALPTAIEIEPAEPDVASPVRRSANPVLPAEVVPVLSKSEPDEPASE